MCANERGKIAWLVMMLLFEVGVAYDGWLIVVGYGFILEVLSRVIVIVVLGMESLVSVVGCETRMQLAWADRVRLLEGSELSCRGGLVGDDNDSGNCFELVTL